MHKQHCKLANGERKGMKVERGMWTSKGFNKNTTNLPKILVSYIQNALLRHFGLPDMDVGYQKCQAVSPDGCLDFGIISTPVYSPKTSDIQYMTL